MSTVNLNFKIIYNFLRMSVRLFVLRNLYWLYFPLFFFWHLAGKLVFNLPSINTFDFKIIKPSSTWYVTTFYLTSMLLICLRLWEFFVLWAGFLCSWYYRNTLNWISFMTYLLYVFPQWFLVCIKSSCMALVRRNIFFEYTVFQWLSRCSFGLWIYLVSPTTNQECRQWSQYSYWFFHKVIPNIWNSNYCSQCPSIYHWGTCW